MQQLKLISLNGVKIDQQVYEVILQTEAGEISVFPGHERLVTMAKPGPVAVRFSKDSDFLEYYAISGGIVKIDQDGMEILVDEADYGEDIIESDSKEALERAIKMRDSAQDQIELERAHQLIDRHNVRLKVADLRRRSHHRNNRPQQ